MRMTLRSRVVLVCTILGLVIDENRTFYVELKVLCEVCRRRLLSNLRSGFLGLLHKRNES